MDGWMGVSLLYNCYWTKEKRNMEDDMFRPDPKSDGAVRKGVPSLRYLLAGLHDNNIIVLLPSSPSAPDLGLVGGRGGWLDSG